MTAPSTAGAGPSPFEFLITCNPPILESLVAQIPTETILHLYHTSAYLQQFLRNSPTAWRYISWRLHQPAATPAQGTNSHPPVVTRQSNSYALDRLTIYVLNPFSTRLVSLELDNTAVSGGILTQTVLIQRRETLRHLSVRGCKNVSLKYHINPWLQMHVLAREIPSKSGPPGFDNLALRSIYTYRCRHHRRRPYLPSSLSRKESDSEPTHELVNICHKLGIWTDTAWCTSPGPRCLRRRGYVTMRLPPDPREVWVVFDRLWRSRNWLGPGEPTSRTPVVGNSARKRKRDARLWESEEQAINGEALGTIGEGKAVPTHLRKSHRQFVEDIDCHNCSATILERCEQCSVMMHCSGCRKTLCASCAFDRPYLRNVHATEEEKKRFWWAPGCAVSPCSMQDQDPSSSPANPPNMNANNINGLILPNIKFRWCCTEPVFSGGGGITFGNGASREADRVRAAPLPKDQGWEDAEFCADIQLETNEAVEQCDPTIAQLLPASPMTPFSSTGLNSSAVDNVFRAQDYFAQFEPAATSLPRILCDECYSTEHWKIKCKACSVAICLKHDVGERLKVRVCGSKDLHQEKQDYKSRQKALKWLHALMTEENESSLNPRLRQIRSTFLRAEELSQLFKKGGAQSSGRSSTVAFLDEIVNAAPFEMTTSDMASIADNLESFLDNLKKSNGDPDPIPRPLSRGSNSTGPPSRASSPTPSAVSLPITPEPTGTNNRKPTREEPVFTRWNGCQSFFCPTIRSAGDHRRRCMATIRTCAECKVNVCADCASSMEEPCRCQGCRIPQPRPGDEGAATTSAPDIYRFFCPNCRWDRMQTGKCRIHSRAFLNAQLQAAKRRKRRNKTKKPVEDRGARQGSQTNVGSGGDEAIEGLVEFFNQLNTQVASGQTRSAMTATATTSAPLITTATNAGMTLNVDPSAAGTGSDDIQQLEDMGALARDLIRRIQHLREQIRPPASPTSSMASAIIQPDLAATAATTTGETIVADVPIHGDQSHGDVDDTTQEILAIDDDETEEIDADGDGEETTLLDVDESGEIDGEIDD